MEAGCGLNRRDSEKVESWSPAKAKSEPEPKKMYPRTSSEKTVSTKTGLYSGVGVAIEPALTTRASRAERGTPGATRDGDPVSGGAADNSPGIPPKVTNTYYEPPWPEAEMPTGAGTYEPLARLSRVAG